MLFDSDAPTSLLAKNRVSNNVGGVKHFRAHYSMHAEQCAISLSLKMCQSHRRSGHLGIPLVVQTSKSKLGLLKCCVKGGCLRPKYWMFSRPAK
jgi:hypothetical protein